MWWLDKPLNGARKCPWKRIPGSMILIQIISKIYNPFYCSVY